MPALYKSWWSDHLYLSIVCPVVSPPPPSFQISQREHLEALLNLSRLVSKQGETTHTSNAAKMFQDRDLDEQIS